jgi:MoxR-like ATPase
MSTTDWKIFTGQNKPHNGLLALPAPPPWRFSRAPLALQLPAAKEATSSEAEQHRALPFITSEPMRLAVNAALYLRRPLLLTGKPGTGKSTLIAKVAHELKLGPVLRWPINSRSTVRSGVYEYDAVGRLQAGKDADPPVQDYLTLGPLGTALLAQTWPRALLIDEIDKSDLDFANDLLNVIEDGEYEIPELRRLGRESVEVRDFSGHTVRIDKGRLVCGQFPFVVMTSNAEREFPAPFLRRCVRLTIAPPSKGELAAIVDSHLKQHAANLARIDAEDPVPKPRKAPDHDDIVALIDDFDTSRKENKEVSTDQLLNAVFLTVAMRDGEGRSFSEKELAQVRANLTEPLSGQSG